MGAKAGHDLWEQARAFEATHGDRAPWVAAEKAAELRNAGETAEADFWAQVADCLTDLHAIRHGCRDSPAMRTLSPFVRSSRAIRMP